MKMMKRLGAIATVIAMIAAFGAAPAYADTSPSTGSLTMQGNTKAEYSYAAYQIATFDVGTLNSKPVFVNMKLNAAYKPAITGQLKLDGKSADSDVFKKISGLNAEQTESLAIALRDAAGSSKGDYEAKSGKFDSLPFGYYLVLETAKNAGDGTIISKPILVCIPDPNKSTDIYNVTVNVKNSQAGIEKKIVEHDSKGGQILVDTSTAAIGETVKYQSLSDIPAYPKDTENITYYTTDTFSDGLTFLPDSILNASGTVTIIDNHDPKKVTTVATLQKGVDYKLETSSIGNATFRLTLLSSDDIRTWGNAGYKLLVTYAATLNEKAKTGSTGNPNSVNLTYSIKPGKGDSSYTTPDDTVITYTYKLVVTKEDGSTPLPGATFELRDANGNKVGKEQTTNDKGIATFSILEQGSYSLVETAAPAGYNKLSDPIQFTLGAANDKNHTLIIPNTQFLVTESGNDKAIDFPAFWFLTAATSNCTFTQDDAELNAAVADTPGFILPGTGGIGTTIFTVSGIAILLAGGCMAFLYYRKKKNSENQ